MPSPERMLGFRYDFRANNTQTVGITKLSPDNVDFHIEVEGEIRISDDALVAFMQLQTS
jgi:hypothetical protein